MNILTTIRLRMQAFAWFEIVLDDTLYTFFNDLEFSLEEHWIYRPKVHTTQLERSRKFFYQNFQYIRQLERSIKFAYSLLVATKNKQASRPTYQQVRQSLHA